MAAQWAEDFEGAANGATLLSLGCFDTSGVVDTAQHFSGAKAAKHTMVAALDNALSYGLGKSLAANLVQGDEFWVQAQFFYPVGWDFGNNNDAGLGGNATRVKHFRLQTFHANNSNAGYNDVYLHKEDSTTTKWQFIYEGVQQWAFNVYGDLPSRPAAPITGIVRGNWRKIEYYVKLHSDPSQAKVRLWENDSLVFEINDLATLTSATDYASLFRFCTYVNGGAPQTQSMWTDDWKIYTSSSAPTNLDAGGRVFIGGASVDTTPDIFTFTSVTGAALSSVNTSNTITVSGINTAVSVSVTGGTYSKNGGAYTSSSGTVSNGDTISVRVNSSSSYSASTSATLTISAASASFTVTTQAILNTGVKMGAPTPIASAAGTSNSWATLGTVTGGGSFSYDANKGVLFPITHTVLTLQNPVNYTQCTSEFCMVFKLQHDQLCQDESAGTGTNILCSSNPIQIARTPADHGVLLHFGDNTTTDHFLRMYYGLANNIYFQFYVYNGSFSSNVFFTVNSNFAWDEFTDPATGLSYAEFAVSYNSTNGNFELFINRQLLATCPKPTGYTYAPAKISFWEFNATTNGAFVSKLGFGGYAKDFALYKQKFDPVTFSGNSTGKTIKIAGGVDSFWLGALSSSAPLGAGNVMKSLLEGRYGIGTTIVNGLEVNGQGYFPSIVGSGSGLTASIASIIGQAPNIVFLTPTVNDLALASATFTVGTAADWQTAVINAVNQIGNSGVQYICVGTMWPWVLCGTNGGYGGTNTRGTAFFTDPSLIRAMNAFFMSLKTNPNISAFVQSKIVYMNDMQQILGCNIDGKDYNRNYTAGSHSAGRDTGNLHPSALGQIKFGQYLAGFVARLMLGDGQLFKITSVKLAS